MKKMALVLCVALTACLTRPVVSTEPTTKITFFEEQKLQAVDKIDLLLAIDNSASMKDKQEFLAKAVPRLVERLVTPNCIATAEDGARTVVGPALTDARGEAVCPDRSSPEFKPITDIHIGIVSSSLGNFGAMSPQCKQAHADDRATLLERAQDPNGNDIAVPSEGGNFLAWFPDVEKNVGKPAPSAPYRDAKVLGDAFAALVRGTSDQGCGLEAQLESMYQFLIAPQPWQNIEIGADNRARYVGINQTVLQQRHDFLRPDSLVAVIMLTDEDDSSVDPLSVNGTGHVFMSTTFPQRAEMGTLRKRASGDSTAARGTPICATDPGSPDCTSCAFGGCDPEQTYLTAEEDDMNVRFFDMKRRFGVDPQYPIARYARGLRLPAVPSRDAEHGGPEKFAPYDIAAADCTNPLFHGGELPRGAESMEELCKLQGGEQRDPSLIFFALVGGVPNDLIGPERRDPKTNELTGEAWTAIIGSDPLGFHDRVADGKDPRMVQSMARRDGRPTTDPATPDDDRDNVAFRDYDTYARDLQYACTFPLAKPLSEAQTIDCAGTSSRPSDSPLCAPGAPTEKRAQLRAKAYPTIREAWLVHELGPQGVLGSLCPREARGEETSAEYGYNPVMNEIVDRLANAITSACLPRALKREPDDTVPCLMLEVMPEGLDCTGDGREIGRSIPDAKSLDTFRSRLQLPAGRAICRLNQDASADTLDECQEGSGGWCYLDGNEAGRCAQRIVFNDAVLARAKGSRVYMQCISEYSSAEPQALP